MFSALARERLKASPGGKLSRNAQNANFLTDEGCRAEIQDYLSLSGLCRTKLHAIPHPFFRRPGMGDEKSTFPPGEGFGTLNDNFPHQTFYLRKQP